MWTADDQIRFIRFTAVNKVESMIMDADGSNQRRAGTEVRDLRAGTWSPDGKHVIYSKLGENPYTPFVANTDGTNERPLGFPIGPMDWSPDGTKFVYNTSYPTESSDSEIVIYSFETGVRTNISNNPAFDANPSFSPDGQQVIFNSDRDGNSEIYVMNVDGSGVRRLTNDPAKEAFQAFSPDGTQIVFNSNRENEKVGIFMLNVNDDSPPLKLSDTRYNAEIRPGCWSRDGTRIVYMSDAGGDKFNLYSMLVEPSAPTAVYKDESVDIQSIALAPGGERGALSVKLADGRGELRILDMSSKSTRTIVATDNYDMVPNWSPDGKQIVFANKSEGNTEVFVVNDDGTNLGNLTQNPARDSAPVWSPDGTQIVFSTDRDQRSELTVLYEMNRDGSDQKRLMTRKGFELTPAWSRDGRWIAFAGDRTDGTSRALDIYVTDLTDPAAERIVATRRFHDTSPAFSPDGKRIAFASQGDGNREIYLVNFDGSGLVRLTRNSADDTMPTFSPDGKKIYFVSNRDGKFTVFEMTVP
jgi:Tol biopolymer transport system component